MAEQFTHNGVIYEALPNGKARVVGYASPMAGATPIGGPDPSKPLDIRGKGLSNQNAAVDVRVNEATQNAQIREANAKAGKAESEASIAASNASNPGAELEAKLRGEFQGLPQVKQYTEAVNSLSGMLKSPNTAQGDLQVIYAFAKIMDPGSVVREGEMDMANSTASLVDNLERQYGRISEGNRLPPAVRQGLIESARQKMSGLNATYGQTYQQYRTLAEQNGVNPERVTGPYAGDVVSGIEANYVRNAGGTPRSALADPNADFRTENNPERSAFIDGMVRGGVPFDQAQRLYRDRFPSAPVFEDRAEWNKAVQFAKKFPGSPGSFGQSLDTIPLNQTEQDRNFLGQTIPGQVGTLYLNAATGGIPSFLAGREGQQAIEASRDALGGFSLIPEAAGAITGTLGLNKAIGGSANLLKGVPGIGAPFNFLANNPGARMLTADIGYGSLYGATQNPDNPLAGAALGGAAGLAGNQIGSRVIAPGLRAGAQALGYNPAPALPRANELIAGQAMKADPAQVMGRVQEAADLRMPFTLADADPRLRSLGGSVVRKSPDAFAAAESALGSRTLGQVDRLTGIVEGEMGPRLNLPTFKEGVKKSAQTASRPLYESAKAQPPVDDALLNEMLQTPAGQRAARSGYDEALNNGEPVGDMVEEVDSITGQVRLQGRPSWNVLQRMKFALDEMPDQESLARRFNSRLGALNPDFRKANLAYAKEMRRGDIAEAGYGAASPNVRAPELSAQIGSPKNMKDPALFRQGYGSNLVDKARGMRDSANPYEVASLASPDQLAKMEIISPSFASRFGRARGVEKEMALTNRELFGGSPTQPRAEADKLFEGGAMDAAGGLLLDVASGTPPINAMRAGLFAGRTGFGGLKDAYRLGSLRGAKQRADELAPLLFNPDAEANLAMLGDLVAAKRARDEYVRRTGLIGAGIGAPFAISYAANR